MLDFNQKKYNETWLWRTVHNTLRVEYLVRAHTTYLFHNIRRDWDGTGSLHTSLWKTMTRLWHLDYAISADDLVTQGAHSPLTLMLA